MPLSSPGDLIRIDTSDPPGGETAVYGFNAHLVDSHDDVMRRCHGEDERIHVRDPALQALHAEHVARELLR